MGTRTRIVVAGLVAIVLVAAIAFFALGRTSRPVPNQPSPRVTVPPGKPVGSPDRVKGGGLEPQALAAYCAAVEENRPALSWVPGATPGYFARYAEVARAVAELAPVDTQEFWRAAADSMESQADGFQPGDGAIMNRAGGMGLHQRDLFFQDCGKALP